MYLHMDIDTKVCSWWGSNPQPPPYKSGALTNCATRAIYSDIYTTVFFFKYIFFHFF